MPSASVNLENNLFKMSGLSHRKIAREGTSLVQFKNNGTTIAFAINENYDQPATL